MLEIEHGRSDAILKRPKLRVLVLLLPALVAVGIFVKADGAKKPFRCDFDNSKWAAIGLPSPSDAEPAFSRSLEDEGALVNSDGWAVNLNCSSQEPAIGRLFKRYLTATPKRWPLLALSVWGLSTSEQHERVARTSERFAKIFSHPDTEAYFSRVSIVSALQKLQAGDIKYADALLAVTESKLSMADQPRLRAMVRSLKK